MKTCVAVAAVVAVVGFCLVALYHGLQFWLQVFQETGEDTLSPDRRCTAASDDHRCHLNNLREVQFDFDTGKIDRDDYELLRRRHEVGAIRAMRERDALAEVSGTSRAIADGAKR